MVWATSNLKRVNDFNNLIYWKFLLHIVYTSLNVLYSNRYFFFLLNQTFDVGLVFFPFRNTAFGFNAENGQEKKTRCGHNKCLSRCVYHFFSLSTKYPRLQDTGLKCLCMLSWAQTMIVLCSVNNNRCTQHSNSPTLE